MRVLMLTNMYPHEADRSFGTFVSEQVRALRAIGVDVDVLFVNGRASRWAYLRGFCRLWKQLRNVRYDLIHAHYVFSGWIARAQFGLPVVVSYHAPGQMHTYQGWLAKRLAPLVSDVVVTSDEHKALLGHEGAHIIPCGVDFDRFKPMGQAEARQAVGWPLDRKVLAWIGDPRPEKRVDLAYATGEQLSTLRHDCDLRVVSKVPHDDIPLYMNAADVLLLTSDHEGSPVAVKEALACNLPVVSTDVGDVRQVMADCHGCHIVEQDPATMARAVDATLDLGQRSDSRERIHHLSTEHEAESIMSLYERILANKGGAA